MEENNSEIPKFPSSPRTKEIQWNPAMEQNLKSIGELSYQWRWMHLRSAKRCTMIYDILMYLSIVLGPIAGVLTGITIFEPDSTGISVTVAAVSFIYSIMVSIVKFGKFEELSSKHLTTSGKYSALLSDIKKQLSFERDNRENSVSYLNWVTSCYQEIQNSGPLISDKITQEYLQFSKENKISVPEEYRIEVYHEIDLEAQIDVLKSPIPDIFSKVEEIPDNKMKYELKRFIKST